MQSIQDVMEKHRPKRIRRGLKGGDYEQCQAGCKYDPGDSYGHIAAAIAEAGWVDGVGLKARLKAFGRDCVTHGDMTPGAERMLNSIAEDIDKAWGI